MRKSSPQSNTTSLPPTVRDSNVLSLMRLTFTLPSLRDTPPTWIPACAAALLSRSKTSGMCTRRISSCRTIFLESGNSIFSCCFVIRATSWRCAGCYYQQSRKIAPKALHLLSTAARAPSTPPVPPAEVLGQRLLLSASAPAAAPTAGSIASKASENSTCRITSALPSTRAVA